MNLSVLQENLLVLLCYNQAQALIVRNTVDLNLFGGPFKIIASRAYEYIDRYKKPPGDHISDILADKLDGENKREGNLYADILTSMHGVKDSINTDYVMGQLETFVKRQSLRGIAVELQKLLQRDTEESLEEADALIKKSTAQNVKVFDAGLRLSDKERALEFFDITTSAFPTGIPELDKRGFGPTRKEMWLLIANAKGGKTWSLIHLAKMAMVHRLKVCHISLEMSEARVAQRYLQALFSVSKRNETLRTTKFERDDLGRIADFHDFNISPRISLDDPNARRKLERIIDKWSLRLLDNIIIKQFPTGTLTVNQLKAYLDNLELVERFVPDLLILDYPDIMKLDKDNYRLAIDEIYKELRGIAVDRNIALAIVSQSNRSAVKAKQVGGENVAEAYSKIAHADVIITLSQTEAEERLNLARLHVVGGRNDSDKISIVISQQYGIGNFVVDSNLLVGNYWNRLPDEEEGNG